jgi:hypothetical protein
MPYKNPEDVKRHRREYYLAHREGLKARALEYKRARPVETKEAAHRYYEKNKVALNKKRAELRKRKAQEDRQWPRIS